MADVDVGLLVRIEALPGGESEVEQFLQGGLALVDGEPETITWYAIRLGPTTFGIFDTFPDDSGLIEEPTIEQVALIAAKLPQ